ncbi:phosphoribosyl-AMP cyclohydrolase [Thermopetrobacter sp. TC1]|uniref:phosphoribosyl-AMP cyclohydrolase n=1 Tax=Thermopetrobacter sp. TC1 TaxID=1495045 RepID=UPI0005701D4A|nr:phosphoribosyl-AMP cyclohydrolase [Thermopetrobacter sp. TC1]
MSRIFAERKEADKAQIEEGDTFLPRFDDKGLIPAIVTDADTGAVLMFAWMNAEALEKTLSDGLATFYSRSRGKLWRKGESSGETLKLVEARTDCDQDVIWLKVTPQGRGAACHTGRKSCFYRRIVRNAEGAATLEPVEAERLFDPKDVYGG